MASVRTVARRSRKSDLKRARRRRAASPARRSSSAARFDPTPSRAGETGIFLARPPVSQSHQAEVQGTMQRVEKSIRVNAPASKVYEYWHNFENFPRFMEHVEEVRLLDSSG